MLFRSQQIQPKPPDAVTLVGDEGFEIEAALPEAVKTELAWASHILLTNTVRVGSDYVNDRGEQIGKGVDCIVVKKLTDKLIESDDFPFTSRSWKTDGLSERYVDEVKRGVMLGTLLGKKLQVRSESRETIFSRLKKGKIDGRMVASLGFDNDNVFYQRDIDQFKKANLHISIDYSGGLS